MISLQQRVSTKNFRGIRNWGNDNDKVTLNHLDNGTKLSREGKIRIYLEGTISSETAGPGGSRGEIVR